MQARISSPIGGVLLLWLASGCGCAWAQDAHVHGIGNMDVAIEGARVAIEVSGPGANFVGFEHPPETAGQRAAIAAAERQLRRPAALLPLTPAAGCTLREVALEGLPDSASAPKAHRHGSHDHDPAHGHEHDHDHDDTHGDWHVRYVFSCATPAALASIRTAPWFAAFPETRELRVQVISGFGQSGMTLTPARSRIVLRTR